MGLERWGPNPPVYGGNPNLGAGETGSSLAPSLMYGEEAWGQSSHILDVQGGGKQPDSNLDAWGGGGGVALIQMQEGGEQPGPDTDMQWRVGLDWGQENWDRKKPSTIWMGGGMA